MKTLLSSLIVLLIWAAAPSKAEVLLSGYLQGLYGGRTDQSNPTSTEMTASETRMQLRTEHFGDRGEFFGRLDFVYDGADSARYDWELREAYMKFRLGARLDFKIGRQILTWGTGDLIFINDVFAKDYRSFFVGRDDQYLKAPQNAIRVEYYNSFGNLNFIWSPRFEANRLPTGRILSYYNPYAGGIVGTGLDEMFYFDPPAPPAKFENGEFAARFQRQIGSFAMALYGYKGFYKNPLGAEPVAGMPGMFAPVYPSSNVYGASLRGTIWSGVLWLEGGYFDSRDDPDGDDPLRPNSSVTGMVGFERQIMTNLTANLQWQADLMLDHDKFVSQQIGGVYIREEVRHLLTSRVTKLLMDENLTLSAFAFVSPTDEDVYIRLYAGYKYTDEVTLGAGANIFDGSFVNTEFGQFQKNDNAYLKITYGF